jgi:hypothetical protein
VKGMHKRHRNIHTPYISIHRLDITGTVKQESRVSHVTESSENQRVIRRLVRIGRAWGIEPSRTLAAISGRRHVDRQRRQFLRQRFRSSDQGDFAWANDFRVYGEANDPAGEAKGHYFHQDLMVAQEIFRRGPKRHVDVGSSIYGFVSHVASFRQIDVIDVRPLASQVQEINFHQLDLMGDITPWQQSTDSLSCLHALEHLGLGRYGDPVRWDGWRVGLRNLAEMLLPGGALYLSVPTSNRQRVEFNAHRVFSAPYLLDVLEPSFAVERVAFVLDDGSLVPDVDLGSREFNQSFDSHYGCSVWFLSRR